MEKPKQIVIMIVEDDHDTRVALRSCFEAEGYAVVSAANGGDALARLEEIPAPDLIVLDILMPVLSGDEFLDKIKNDRARSSIPVIQISAHVTEQREGVFAFLRKPFDQARLLKIVEACVSAKKLHAFPVS